MLGYAERIARSRVAIDKARALGIPVIFIHEVHRPDFIDFCSELVCDEDIHSLEENLNTTIASEQTGFRSTDYLIRKKRYSAILVWFFKFFYAV